MAAAAKKRLDLEVLRVNTKAQKLYHRLGFTMTERDETKHYMYKEIEADLKKTEIK